MSTSRSMIRFLRDIFIENFSRQVYTEDRAAVLLFRICRTRVPIAHYTDHRFGTVGSFNYRGVSLATARASSSRVSRFPSPLDQHLALVANEIVTVTPTSLTVGSPGCRRRRFPPSFCVAISLHGRDDREPICIQSPGTKRRSASCFCSVFADHSPLRRPTLLRLIAYPKHNDQQDVYY
jgi:hypothetical protein